MKKLPNGAKRQDRADPDVVRKRRRVDSERIAGEIKRLAWCADDGKQREELIGWLGLLAAKRINNCPAGSDNPTGKVMWGLRRFDLPEAWRRLDNRPRNGRKAEAALARAQVETDSEDAAERALEILRDEEDWTEEGIEWARGYLECVPALDPVSLDALAPEGPPAPTFSEAYAQAKLHEFVSRLGPQDRELFMLRAQGLKGIEIAERLGVSGSLVSLRTKALRVKFKKAVME